VREAQIEPPRDPLTYYIELRYQPSKRQAEIKMIHLAR
jgi:hypothetical protein